jgi:hypothetical protein
VGHREGEAPVQQRAGDEVLAVDVRHVAAVHHPGQIVREHDLDRLHGGRVDVALGQQVERGLHRGLRR